ncbi:MAG: hypothetical protein AABX86_01205 [Nanoarchaeota archaeon]
MEYYASLVKSKFKEPSAIQDAIGDLTLLLCKNANVVHESHPSHSVYRSLREKVPSLFTDASLVELARLNWQKDDDVFYG